VIEQAKELRRDGYGIDFYSTSYDVGERMGLIERLKAQQIPLDYIAYVNRAGKPVTKMTTDLLRKVLDGKYMALMRWTLQEALYEALDGQVETRFGCSLTSLKADEEKVEVTFTDGTRESFDLLIGADGVHSRTRELVFGPEEQFSYFLGYMVACYALEDRYNFGRAWQMYTTPGRLSGAYPSPQEGRVITFFMYHTRERERITREQRLPRLREVFAGMGWVTPELLADIAPNESIFMDAVSQIRMQTWHRGRVALVGDACGCPTLVSGQGAALAMGEAYLLAEALREASDYREAFRLYEERTHPHILAHQKGAHDLAKSFAPLSSFGILTQRLLLNVLLRESFSGLIKRLFSGQSILPPQESRSALPVSRQ
jgi:2-polyprenyl-6-methoxyphenol hydroxylase-like FAD-dependent oxidoreductase